MSKPIVSINKSHMNQGDLRAIFNALGMNVLEVSGKAKSKANMLDELNTKYPFTSMHYDQNTTEIYYRDKTNHTKKVIAKSDLKDVIHDNQGNLRGWKIDAGETSTVYAPGQVQQHHQQVDQVEGGARPQTPLLDAFIKSGLGINQIPRLLKQKTKTLESFKKELKKEQEERIQTTADIAGGVKDKRISELKRGIKEDEDYIKRYGNLSEEQLKKLEKFDAAKTSEHVEVEAILQEVQDNWIKLSQKNPIKSLFTMNINDVAQIELMPNLNTDPLDAQDADLVKHITTGQIPNKGPKVKHDITLHETERLLDRRIKSDLDDVVDRLKHRSIFDRDKIDRLYNRSFDSAVDRLFNKNF